MRFKNPALIFAVVGLIIAFIAGMLGYGSGITMNGLLGVAIGAIVAAFVFAIVTPKRDKMKDFIGYFLLFFGGVYIAQIVALISPIG